MTRQDIELILEQVATWPEEAQEEFLTSFNEIEAKHVCPSYGTKKAGDG
jgi:hypothetical protein